MKTNVKKNVLLIALGFFFAISMFLFIGITPVKAADPITVGDFQIMEEASIRIGETGGTEAGIRFRARIDDATYTALTAEGSPAYMGFLITPKQFYDAVAGQGDYINTLSNYVGEQGTGIIVDNTKFYNEEGVEGYKYTNGAVIGMKENNVELEYTLIAYIYTGAEYVYSVPSADFSRTYKEIANDAVLSGKNDISVVRTAAYLSDLGKSTNPIILRSQEDFDTLSNAAANDADFSGVTCALYADEGISVDCTDEFFANFGGVWKATATPVKKNHTGKTVETEGTIPTATEGGVLDKIICTDCGETLQESVEVVSGLNYIPTQADIDNGLYHVSSKTDVEYFAAGEVPTTFTYGSTPTVVDIDNSLGYNGPAIRVKTSSSSRGLMVDMPYTGEQYKAYAEANGYDTVKVWMAINSSGNMTSTAGYMLGVFGNDRQQWKCLALTIDEFVGTFGTMTAEEGASYDRVFTADPTQNSIIYRLETYSNWTWEILIGNIEFITHNEADHAPLKQATCTELAICSICYQPYGELGNHTENVEIPAVEPTSSTAGNTAKIVCSVCNEVVQESVVLPAYGIVASEENVGKIYETASATYELSFAQAGVDIPSTNGTIPYTGDAFKFHELPHNITMRASFNYTKAQYQELVTAGKIKYVRLAYYVETIGDWGTQDITNNTSTNIFGVAKYGAKTYSLAMNEWKYILITGQEFVDTFSSDDDTDTELFKNFIAVGSTLKFNFYVSNIEMLSEAPVGFFYNGDVDFIPNADNYDRAYSGRSSYTTEFVEQIPATSPASKDITNTIGYTGAATQIYYGSTNFDVFLKMNYSKAEYMRLAEINGWTGIKFYYAWSGSGSLGATTSIIGAWGSNSTNKVNEITLTMEQFYTAFTSDTSSDIAIKRSAWSTASYVYVGNFTFTTDAQ